MAKVYPTCSICEKTPSAGIHGGLRILSVWLCHDCLDTLNQEDSGTENYKKLTLALRKAMSTRYKWLLQKSHPVVK